LKRRLAIVIAVLLLAIAGAILFVSARRGPDGMALYREGRAHLVAGRHDDAEPLLRQAVELLPSDAQIRFTLAAALHQQGRVPDAERELREALRSDPGKDEALILLGQILMQRGEHDEAAETFRRSLADRTQPRVAYQMLAALGERRNDLAMLVEALDGESRADPESPEVMLRLAEAHMERFWRSRDPRVKIEVKNALDGCVERCAYSLQLRPDQPPVHLMRAQAQVRFELWGVDKGRLGEAVISRRAARDAPGADLVDAEILWAEALGAEARGDEEECRRKREEALELVRTCALSAATEAEALRVVRLLEYQGTGEHALNLLKELRAKWAGSPDTALVSARVLLRTGRSKEALELLREVRDAGQGTAEVSSAIVLGHIWAGDWAGAVAETERLRERDEATRDVLAFEVIARCEIAAQDAEQREEQLSRVEAILSAEPGIEETRDVDWCAARGRFVLLRAESREDVEKGRDILKDAFRRNPGDLPSGLWLARAQMLLHRGPTDRHLDDALEVLSHILTAAPDWLPARVRMAEVCLRNDLPERAAEHARYVLERDGDAAGLRMILARACIAQGGELETAAIDELERVREDEAGNALARLLLGRLYLRQGHPALARERFDEALGAATDREDRRRVTEAIARVYSAENLPDQAVATLEKLVADEPESSRAKLAFADLLVSLGRHELALEELREISQANPGDVAVRRRMCEVYFEIGKDDPEIELIVADLRARDPGSPDVVFLAATHELLRAKLANAADRREEGESLARSAAEGLETYVRLRADDPKGHFGLGVARYLLGDLEGAAQAIRDASDRGAAGGPHAVALARIQAARANLLLAKGRLPEAVDLLKGVITLDPESDVERKILASTLLRMGREGASEALVREILVRGAGDPEARVLQGNVLRRSGRLRDAAGAYAKAVAEVPDNAVWRILLAQTLMGLGETDLALKHLEEATKLVPDSEPVRRLWVQAMLVCGRSGDALGYAE
jgi:tetratricopeptide (TPR) repeat protein